MSDSVIDVSNFTRKRKLSDTFGKELEDGPVAKILLADNYSYLENLCDELLLKIFKNLDGNSLHNMTRISNRFYQLIKDDSLWINIDLSSNNLMLSDIKLRLRYINEQSKSIKIKGMVSTYPNKNWKNHTLSNDILQYISKKCPQLKSFELQDAFLNFQDTKWKDFPLNMNNLFLHNIKVNCSMHSTSHFSGIERLFHSLSKLAIEECNFFEPYDLVPLSKLVNLKWLSVKGNRLLKNLIPYASIAAKFGFKKLEYLDIRSTPIVDSDLQCFNSMKNLRELLLAYDEDTNSDESDYNQPCSNRSRLTYSQENVIVINFSGGQINRNVAEVEINLRIPNSELNYANLNLINSENNILEENDRGAISDRSICSFGIARIPVPIGIVRIHAVSIPPNNCLERLTVNNYHLVTDYSLQHLSQCSPNLTYLNLSGTQVTKTGVENFRLAKPECVVICDHLI